ncbi:hypothetical protein, partial [Escherichia marmotae]|uniref:hypothetical protein n=1 Tax=Escherichia marmotae TaxID=1499973 RepID=UPI002FDF86F3
GAGRTSDGNGSHASTLKSPSYTKSVSWQHYLNFVLFADYLYKKMPHVHLFPIVQKDKYHWGRENHLSGNSLEFRSIPFILPYHFEKF